MTLGGSNEPCGFIQVTSIGSLGPEINQTHVTVITDYVHQATGIPKEKYDKKKLNLAMHPMCNIKILSCNTLIHYEPREVKSLFKSGVLN